MGQLTLADVDGLGAAAVRAIRWFTVDCTDEFDLTLESFVHDMNAVNGDITRANTAVPPGMHAAEGFTTLERLNWAERLWVSDEWQERYKGPAWCLDVRSEEHVSIDVHLRMYFPDGEPFTVALESERRDRTGRLTSTPEFLKWARARGDQFPNFRRTLQGVDALSRYVSVTIDPDWKDKHLKESVMAQVVEWFIRVDRSPHARLPDLAPDVYAWWERWGRIAAPAATRHERSLAELFEIARRSVRPSSAAGHRLYWKKSLQSGSDGLLDRAAAEAKISKRTAYERLRKGGRHLRDFQECSDPLTSLAEYLMTRAPPSRLPDKRKLLISLLQQSGINAEAARKLERRIRQLPASEQERRVRSTIRRAAQRGA